jgi:anthranilate 1,2-dioxygenase large subunit
VRRSSGSVNNVLLDPGVVGTSNTLISEAAIRAMYVYYRQVMGLQVQGASA